MSKKSLFDSDDDSGGIDHSGYAWSVGSSNIYLHVDSYAKGGTPGRPGSGGGGGTGGTTPAPYTSGDPSVLDSQEFNVKVVFQTGNWTDSLIQGFKDAADAISSFIKGDIPDSSYNGQYVDDITISAALVTIDGPGKILGSSGPDLLRGGSYFPIHATMQFDIADASTYDSMGLMNDIDLHEMLHGVGFGTIWSYKGLVAGANTLTPTFIGAQATAYYDANGGVGSPRVEEGYGSGTALAHWDEQTFGSELMTGFINNPDTFSYMTVASLGDLGYSIVDVLHYTAPAFI